MFSPNKKLMLCASVGGNVEDYLTMIEVDIPFIKCAHIPPVHHVYHENKIPKYIAGNFTNIELKPIGFDNEFMGYVGRCPKCHKVYYMGCD